MKKIFVATTAFIVIYSSCKKTSSEKEEIIPGDEIESVATQRKCAADDVLQLQLEADPGLGQKMEAIEAFTRGFVENPQAARLLPDGTIEIPVVVNVLYRTSAQNISENQIQSQITVLKKDFSATNADYNNTPSIFKGVRSGNVKVTFVLDQIVRKSTTKSSWQTNDAMKKNAQGGINPTSPTTKLNIWVCNLSGGILGYAQFPGGNSSTDGIVIDDNAFGTTGTVSVQFNKGRTATHEVGHWLNLRHIWGDANCGSDFVGDTPKHNTYNYGCPSYPHYSTCSGTPVEMTMNYMDYTDDGCMFMFSAGQKSRMLAVFATGGPRNSFAKP